MCANQKTLTDNLWLGFTSHRCCIDFETLYNLVKNFWQWYYRLAADESITRNSKQILPKFGKICLHLKCKLEKSLTSHPTQSRSFRRCWQPITWLIQYSTGNTQTKNNSKSKQHKKTAKQNYPGSVASYDTWPRNDMGLFYEMPSPHRAIKY